VYSGYSSHHALKGKSKSGKRKKEGENEEKQLTNVSLGREERGFRAGEEEAEEVKFPSNKRLCSGLCIVKVQGRSCG
jgi:hypothetical protein